VLTVRYSQPRWISIKPSTQTIAIEYTDGNNSPTVTSAKYTLIDAAGVSILDEVSAAVVQGSASITLANSTISTYLLGAQFTEEWDIVYNGETITFQRDVVLVKASIRSMVVLEDLYGEISRFRDIERALNVKGQSLQIHIDAAFDEIVGRLMGEDQYPWLAVNLYAIKTPHKYLAISKAMASDSVTVPNMDKFQASAAFYSRYNEEWKRMKLRLDSDGDGVIAADEEPLHAGALFINVPSNRW